MAFADSPIELDRGLARAASQWAAWQRRLRAGPASEDEDDDVLAPFRAVTGLSLFRELWELPEHDPLRTPLLRWVYRLAEQRIDCDVLTRLERERRRLREVPEAPGRAAVSVAHMLDGCLQEPARRQIWMRLFSEHAPPVSAIGIELWQRRREVARRMGLTGPAQIESALLPPAAEPAAEGALLPADVPGTPAGLQHNVAPAGDLSAELARRLSEQLRERVRELAAASAADLVECGLGRDVRGNWPSRLSPQRLADYFRDGDLLRSLELRPEPMPRAHGAASFCRALGQLGAAWLEALAPQDQPFVVAHDPYGLRRHEAAALFSLLPLNEKFLSRHLDVPRTAQPDVQRRLAQLWLLDLAQAALRVRLRAPALAGELAFREAYGELLHQDLGISLSPAVAGALFRLDIEDEQRLLGRLLAAQRTRELTEAHDEDWFRNPRALEQLRAEAHRPPDVQVSFGQLEPTVGEITRQLMRLLR